MRLLLLALPLLLIGCSDPDVPERITNSSLIYLEVVDVLTHTSNPHAAGAAKWDGAICHVQIRADVYPRCITHEVMHCLSGAWHDDRPNSDWCDVRE